MIQIAEKIDVPVQLLPLGHDSVNNVDLYIGNQMIYLYGNEPNDHLVGAFPLNAQLIQALAPIGGDDEDDLPPAAETY